MKKKIFLWIVWFLFLISLYFYIFPIYKDFWIEDTYFETNHYDKEFDSEDNGYWEFTSFLDILAQEQNNQVLWYFDAIWKGRDSYDKDECIENTSCFFITRSLDFIKKDTSTEELREFLLNEDNFYKTEGFKSLLFISRLYSNYQKKILNKEYVSSFDKWNELESITTFTDIIRITRVMKQVSFYYIEKGDIQKWVEIFTNNNNFIIELLKKWDFRLIEVMVLRTLLHMNFKNLDDIIENYNLSNENKDIIRQNLLNIDINNELYQNAFKREYQFTSEVLFDRVFWDLEIKKVFIHKLFYSQKDTLSLLKKITYQLVENWEIDLQIKRNGSNFLWRTLLQGSYSISYDSQYEKIDKLNALKQGILEKIGQ